MSSRLSRLCGPAHGDWRTGAGDHRGNLTGPARSRRWTAPRHELLDVDGLGQEAVGAQVVGFATSGSAEEVVRTVTGIAQALVGLHDG